MYIYISNKLIVTVMISHLPVDTRTERKKLGPLNPGTWFLSKSWDVQHPMMGHQVGEQQYEIAT